MRIPTFATCRPHQHLLVPRDFPFSKHRTNLGSQFPRVIMVGISGYKTRHICQPIVIQEMVKRLTTSEPVSLSTSIHTRTTRSRRDQSSHGGLTPETARVAPMASDEGARGARAATRRASMSVDPQSFCTSRPGTMCYYREGQTVPRTYLLHRCTPSSLVADSLASRDQLIDFLGSRNKEMGVWHHPLS